MQLTIMTQNIARGGLYNSSGEYGDRWPQLAERINEIKPDVLLLQELNGWSNYGHKQLVRACNDLGMVGAPLSPTQTGYGTGLLFRPEVLGNWQYHNASVAHETTHGYAVTGFDVGLPSLLNISPMHLCYYSGDKAAIEAQLITNKTYARTPFAVVGGDANYSPAHSPDPDPSLSKPYNHAARTVIDSDSTDQADYRANRKVAWTFMRAGFVDAAQHLYEQTGDESLLVTTAIDERIDQIWVSQALAPALTSYWTTKKNPEATDHAGVVVTLEIDKVDLQSTFTPDLL